MKHFRDLVLSTKEPALHNVLWIKPDKTDLTKYWVMMYEDGWKPLFGEGGSSARGINYTVVKTLPDGYVVQLVDDTLDPSKNLYPKTKAKYVYLSNSVDVETAINNINQQLYNISTGIKKAIRVKLNIIEHSSEDKTGKTYWVEADDSGSDIRPEDLRYYGEGILRQYTSNSEYTKIELNVSDILLLTEYGIHSDNASRDLTWVTKEEFITEQGSSRVSKQVYIKIAADLAYVNDRLQDVTVINEFKVDGQDVIVNKVVNLYDKVKSVYIINHDNLNSYYPGNAKQNKVFMFNYGENLADNLIRYSSASYSETRDLEDGTILYNLDMHGDYNEKTFYQYTVIDYGNEVIGYLIPLVNSATVMDYVSPELTNLHESITNETKAYVESHRLIIPAYIINAEDFDRMYPVGSREGKTFLFGDTSTDTKLYKYTSESEYEPILLTDGLIIYNLDDNSRDYIYQTFYQVSLSGSLNRTSFNIYPIINANNLYTFMSPRLAEYVSATTYNNRMAVTPTYYNADWIITEQDPNNPGVIPYPANPTVLPTPALRFNEMWTAIYNSRTLSHPNDITTPLFITLNGSIACYFDTEYLNPQDWPSEHPYNDAVSFTLKFFDGNQTVTYEVAKSEDGDHNVILTVEQTT